MSTTHDSTYMLIASLHGITGLVIFITGILQFIMKKGNKTHRIIGRIYNYSWIVILVSGAYIGSPIIVAIVLMGFYLSVTGVRLAIRKGKPYGAVDKAILAVAVIIELFMIGSAIYLTIKQYYTFAIIGAFFALLYGFVMVNDVMVNIYDKGFFSKKNKYGKLEWYMHHLLRMEFSFITAVGAFTAVQNVFGNTVLNFILPALFGFVAVRISRRYFVKKLGLAKVQA